MALGLTREQKTEIVLISGERSTRVIAVDFIVRHPNRPPIRQGTAAKFQQTGSVLDLPKSGRNKFATDEATTMAILASFSKNSHCRTQRLSQESGMSRTTIGQILAMHKWHPYKIQLLHHLNKDDPDPLTSTFWQVQHRTCVVKLDKQFANCAMAAGWPVRVPSIEICCND